MDIAVTRHSGEDVDITITGSVGKEPICGEVVFDPKDYSDCVTARVMNIFRAIQGGVVAVLTWDNLDTPILPLEGIGATDLNKFNGLCNPRKDGWDGKIRLWVYPKSSSGYFTISLELSKQRN